MTTTPSSSVGATIESDITAIVAKAAALLSNIPAAISFLETEVEDFFEWLAGETPAITAAVQTAIGLVGQVQAAGVTIPTGLTTDIAALNSAVAGLNAVAAATNAGKNPAQAVIAGYSAIKSVQAATANVSVAAIAAATTIAAPPATPPSPTVS